MQGSIEQGRSKDKEYEGLIWPIRTSCRIFGCWPDRLQRPSGRLFRGLMVGLMCLSCFATTSDAVLFWGVDMNETIECSLVCCAFYLALLRVIVFTLRQSDMYFVVETMRRDWADSSPADRELLRERSGLAYRLAKLFIISVFMGYLGFTLMPIVEIIEDSEAERKLPFRGYFYFNHTASMRSFGLTYLVSEVNGTFGCSTIAGATSFSLVTTIHAAAKFSLVQRDFAKIETREWTATGPEIAKAVRKHQQCIRFAEKVEGIINLLALAQFIISTGLICFAGFQLTTMLEDRARLMKYTSFLQSAIMELFIFSYSGQMLKTESENVAEFAYGSGWIGSVSPVNLKLVSMRSRKPCTITAGKFYDMSLESFLKVLSSSFSYFTVLMAMKEE